MQFLCEDMDLAGQLGVGFELEFLSFKVVVGFGLLEGSLAVLADHDERRQEDRFKGNHQSQGRPRALFQNHHPYGEKASVNPDEVHSAGECGDAIGQGPFSAGHTAAGVNAVVPVEELVARIEREVFDTLDGLRRWGLVSP
jgi:hypothetical protein